MKKWLDKYDDGGPIEANYTDASVSTAAPMPIVPVPKKPLKMLQSDLAGTDAGIDPKIFGKDLAPALDAYNKQVGIADSALTSRNKTYNLDNPIATLGKGKFQGVKITKEMADDAINAAKKYNRDPIEILALMGQESTFSQSGAKSEQRDLNQRSMTSGWNTSEDYQPYKPERFLADKQVPGIGTVKIGNKTAYTIDDLDAVKAALVKRPGLMAQYMKKIGKTPIAQENYIDMAAGFIAKKGLAGYNPGDPNYTRDVMNSKALLQKSPELMKYLKSKNTSTASEGQFHDGGSLPGAVGFTYARTQDPAPSNGKYAKKTLASAQDGKSVQQKRYDELYVPIEGKVFNVIKTTDDYLKLPHSTQGFLDKTIAGFSIDSNRNIPPMDPIIKEVQNRVTELPKEELNKLLNTDWSKMGIVDAMKNTPSNVSYLDMLKYVNHFNKLKKKGYTLQNGGEIVDPMGQWAHPGEITTIPGNDITMQGVNYPVLGISDTGDTKMMQPGEDYKFKGKKVVEYPIAQDGKWLDKYTPEPVRQDATRNVIPRKMTDDEKLEAVAQSDQAQKRALNTAKEVIAERKSKTQTTGDLNTPGTFNTTEKFRAFPKSVGGAGEIFDEYINPAKYVGVLADGLGESVAARDPKGIATSLALSALGGGLGFDPLGSTDRFMTKKGIPFVKELVSSIDDKYIIPRQFKNEIAQIKGLNEGLANRFANSEVAARLKNIGIDPNNMDLPSLTFSKTGSSYSGYMDNINMDMRQIARLKKTDGLSHSSVYEHELGHYFQKEANKSSPEFKQRLEDYHNQLSKYKSPKNQKLWSLGSDDIIKDYNSWKNNIVSKPSIPMAQPTATPIDDYAKKMLSPKDDLSRNEFQNFDYFNHNYGNEELERLPHLREMRQNMVERGIIKDQYAPINEEHIEKFLNLNTKDRVSSFVGKDPSNIHALKTIFKMAPAIAPIAVGVSTTSKKQKEGGWLNKYK